MTEFEELVDAHYQALYRFGLSLAKNPDRAADLVQQTFCIWAGKGHQLKDRSKAKTWLFTTLYREHLGQARRSVRYPEQELGDAENQLPAHEPDVERRMDGQRAVELLGALDETFRAPLTLFYMQQHSYKEIAEVLDVPIGTVMSRISRGKEQLRRKMTGEPASAPKKIVEFQPEAFKKSNG
jgi:RNA polymerase sigma-70 factor (ECF subfamily)